MPPMEFVIDYTSPYMLVDLVDGSAPLTGGGPPKSFKRPRTDQPPEIPVVEVNVSVSGGDRSRPNPQAIYSVLDVPISTCKAVRIGIWSTSPVDSDALKGIIYPNFLNSLERRSDLFDPPKEWPSKIPEAVVNVSVASSSNILLPVRIDEDTYSIGPGFKTEETEGCKGKASDVKQPPLNYASSPFPPGSVYCTEDLTDRTWMVDALKENLKRDERTFKSQYCYDTTTMEERNLVTALSPNNTFTWKEESSGIMWFGAYGVDEICVVTLGGHLDRKRVCGCLASTNPKSVLSSFRKCVLSELEDLADPSSKRCEKLGRSFDTPFFVVSATPGTSKTLEESGHETSSVGYPAEAIWCVQVSRLLRKDQDSGDAIKLAIFGFQHLVGKKCEAKDIEVTVLFGRNFGSGYTRDLDISEIVDYLAAVEPLMPSREYVSERSEMYP